MKLPLVSLAILGGQIAASAAVSGGDWKGGLNYFGSLYTGVDFLGGRFAPQNLLLGYGPWVVKRFLLPIARPRLGGMHLPVSLS